MCQITENFATIIYLQIKHYKGNYDNFNDYADGNVDDGDDDDAL